MEAHHPHQHIHHEKKWKEYLLEFIMIFLAVSLSFLAEGLRENINNHKHEKEYVKGILEDLESDSAQLSFLMTFYTDVQNLYDSTSILLDDPVSPANLLKAYRLTASADDIIQFNTNDRTFSGMESSGNLRLLRNQKVKNEITEYYAFVGHNLASINDAYNQLYNVELTGSRQQVFDYSILNKMGKWTTGKSGDVFISIFKPYPLYDNDNLLYKMILASQKNFDPATRKQKIFDWKNKQQLAIKMIDYALKYGYISLQQKGQQVMKIIRQEYHL